MYFRKNVILALLLAGIIYIGNTLPIQAEDIVQTESIQDDLNVDTEMKLQSDVTGNQKIGYVFVDETDVILPGVQNIVVGFLGDISEIEDAVLQYHSVITGEPYELKSNDVKDGAVLFSKVYEEAVEDEFALDSISYTINGENVKKTFCDENIDNLRYRVVDSTKREAQDIATSECETNIYTLGNDDTITICSDDAEKKAVEDTIVEAVKQSGDASSLDTRTRTNETSKKLVIYLVAGHDATHTGATANGLKEEELSFKVQQYCKEELQRYGDVIVYTDRDTLACKYPGSSTSFCLNQRVKDAASAGANVFVDLHFNSTGIGTTNGAEVFYPNISFNESIHKEGNVLANQILDQLGKLGLYNRGAKIRNCTTNDRDKNGNLDDYYTSISSSKAYGMTGLIVEHAFIDGTSDAEKLRNEDFLKQLGVADAKGIASAYGLVKGEDTGKMFYLDVKSSDWYYDSVKYAYENDIMTGLRLTQFGPDEKLARAQFATILYRMQQEPEIEYTGRFLDVPDGQFYTDAVLWASGKNVEIVKGYDDTGMFGPSDLITREQLVTMMYRYANFMKVDTSEQKELNGFYDAEYVSDFAIPAMKWATAVSIIEGDNGGIKPGKNANRAECATIVMRFMKYLDEHSK